MPSLNNINGSISSVSLVGDILYDEMNYYKKQSLCQPPNKVENKILLMKELKIKINIKPLCRLCLIQHVQRDWR
jgi:hypothetical protein